MNKNTTEEKWYQYEYRKGDEYFFIPFSISVITGILLSIALIIGK